MFQSHGFNLTRKYENKITNYCCVKAVLRTLEENIDKGVVQ